MLFSWLSSSLHLGVCIRAARLAARLYGHCTGSNRVQHYLSHVTVVGDVISSKRHGKQNIPG
jgi:hypothetical protein